MDLQQRLKQLEDVHDWQGILEELEKALAAESQPSAKAPLHLRIGVLLDEKFVQSAKALKHFQDAIKMQPSLMQALELARRIYWQLGKLNMVQKLVELELKPESQGPKASALLIEMGDVLTDQGDSERATEAYARALGASGGTNHEARRVSGGRPSRVRRMAGPHWVPSALCAPGGRCPGQVEAVS